MFVYCVFVYYYHFPPQNLPPTNFIRALRLLRLIRVLRLLKLLSFLKNVDVMIDLILATLSQGEWASVRLCECECVNTCHYAFHCPFSRHLRLTNSRLPLPPVYVCGSLLSIVAVECVSLRRHDRHHHLRLPCVHCRAGRFHGTWSEQCRPLVHTS